MASNSTAMRDNDIEATLYLTPRLLVEVASIKKVNMISFYTVVLKTVDTPRPLQWSIDKRYNDFHRLDQ